MWQQIIFPQASYACILLGAAAWGTDYYSTRSSRKGSHIKTDAVDSARPAHKASTMHHRRPTGGKVHNPTGGSEAVLEDTAPGHIRLYASMCVLVWALLLSITLPDFSIGFAAMGGAWRGWEWLGLVCILCIVLLLLLGRWVTVLANGAGWRVYFHLLYWYWRCYITDVRRCGAVMATVYFCSAIRHMWCFICWCMRSSRCHTGRI